MNWKKIRTDKRILQEKVAKDNKVSKQFICNCENKHSVFPDYIKAYYLRLRNEGIDNQIADFLDGNYK